jgi:hypothetical protein
VRVNFSYSSKNDGIRTKLFPQVVFLFKVDVGLIFVDVPIFSVIILIRGASQSARRLKFFVQILSLCSSNKKFVPRVLRAPSFSRDLCP